MGKGGGRPKEIEVWKHVTVLEGKEKKVKCNHCGFVFAASNNRIKAHINQIKCKGIRPCTPVSKKGTSEKQDLLDSQGLLTMDKPRVYNRLNERMLDLKRERIKFPQQESIDKKAMHQERIKVGPFYVSNIVNEPDLQLIQYVFENYSSERCTPFRSSHLHLPQSQLITLRPETHLDSGIIDVFAGILTESERRKRSKPVNWYLPVMFSSAALSDDASSFLDFVERQKLKETYMFDDLKDCEKIFIPVHVEKDSCGHYYLNIIHMKNQEIEIWDSLCDQFIDKAKRDQTTQKLLLAMERLFGDGTFKEFYSRIMRNIPLQPNGHDCGIFVINYMQQLDNYVREKPLFQFDSTEERLNVVLKLLKSDLNREKGKLYAELGRWHSAQVESESESSCGIEREGVDSDNKVKRNNVGFKTGSGWSSLSHNSESEEDLQVLVDQGRRKRKRMISNRKVARRRRMRMRMPKHLDDLGAQVAQLEKEPRQILTSANRSPEHYSSVHHEISALRAQVSDLCAKVESPKERISHLTATNNAASAKPSYDHFDFNSLLANLFPDDSTLDQLVPDDSALDQLWDGFDGVGSRTGRGTASGSGSEI
ncbi:uncharacterized protein LOC114759755 isoform X1 [Neltuma alba]|uniref:uncharacterized protein LOC114759755 isoform X1 n=1 Tax=Neltuma alba TaxID=207710 RepID=UPI0010A5054B|nr:uncharacterized protein LOC114759755 isoform X1 [Prosopis alba]